LKEIILGTAGHIDHGKTSLIKRVTGVNTDRLKEEQQRGITIELGFASLDLPDGLHVGIVDVPGHEKFVKNMVAGASGIDMVAMIIAADEGVMPQTVEHLEICSLLGIRHGLVVLTKTDMVDEEWLELVQEDIAEFLEGTFLENSPMVPVSSATGEGVDDFLKALGEVAAQVPERSAINLFRLPVDRVFTMRGFGTVITGTLTSGQVRVGDAIMIYPSKITSKVRGLQVHNAGVEEARHGMRTAINFQGLDRAAVQRGDVVSTPDALAPSYMVDVSVHYLKSNKKPIKNRTRVRFHSGTSEVLGNLILLESDELPPGEAAAAQLRLDTPVTLVRDDRFVLRSYSPVRTVAGGRVLDPAPLKHRRLRPEVVEGVRSLLDAEPAVLISHHVNGAGYRGVSFPELKVVANLSDKPLNAVLQGLLTDRTILQTDKENRIFIHRNAFEKLKSEIRDCLDAYHRNHPLKAGMSKEEIKSKLPPVLSPKLFNMVLQAMARDGEIFQEERTVRSASHAVSLGMDQEAVKEKILTAYKTGGLRPPYFKDLQRELDVDGIRSRDVLNLLVEEGKLVKAKEDLFFDAAAIAELKARLVAYFAENPDLSAPDFKEMTGLSRKYLIPLLEYFDAINVTIRVGDVRKLRKG
jgi:selenocysteine-specific elongation factor